MRTMLAVAVVVAVSGLAHAADKKNDPTGTWKWETEMNGMKRTSTLKLKLDGDKLTGAMVGRQNMETAIGDATFKDGTVSFTVTREMNGNKIVTKYTGKVDGDTLKGSIERERNGEKVKTDFEAKKEKAEEKKDK
jgi:hypothetical protein